MPHAAPPSSVVTAVILAGSRPGPDPLLAGTDVGTKALLPIAGRPMLAHVLGTLSGHAAIGRVIVLAQEPGALAADAAVQAAIGAATVEFRRSGDGISRSVGALMDDAAPYPVLLTTADNVLLSPAMVDHFVAEAGGADLAVAMVERRVLLARYPESRRTWLKFRDGWWSGANLFWLGSARARPVVALWEDVERDRKKGWKVLAAFGPWLLAGALLRLLSLRGGVARVGRRFRLDARLVAMPQAEACIDADKPVDVALIERILAG